MKKLLAVFGMLLVSGFALQRNSEVATYVCYAPGEAFDCRLWTRGGLLATWTLTDQATGVQRVFTNSAVIYVPFGKPSVNTYKVVVNTTNATDSGTIRCNKTRCH